MVRSGERRKGKRVKEPIQDDFLVPSLTDLKKDKHRHCESVRVDGNCK